MARKSQTVKRPHPNRHRFSREECQRGYEAALAKCNESWGLGAWFFRRVRGWYRAKKRAQG